MAIQAGRWKIILFAGLSGSGKLHGGGLDVFIDSGRCREADGSAHRLRSWSFLAALAQAIWIMIDFLNEKLAFMNEFEISIHFWPVITYTPLSLSFPVSPALGCCAVRLMEISPRPHVLVAIAFLFTLVANIAKLT